MNIGQVENMGYVYILHSKKNDTFYIGSTNNIERRYFEHCEGKSKYTKHILPVELVFSQQCDTLDEARLVEYRLKKLKSKEIIRQIIRDGFIKLMRR